MWALFAAQRTAAADQMQPLLGEEQANDERYAGDGVRSGDANDVGIPVRPRQRSFCDGCGRGHFCAAAPDAPRSLPLHGANVKQVKRADRDRRTLQRLPTPEDEEDDPQSRRRPSARRQLHLRRDASPVSDEGEKRDPTSLEIHSAQHREVLDHMFAYGPSSNPERRRFPSREERVYNYEGRASISSPGRNEIRCVSYEAHLIVGQRRRDCD